MNSQKTKTNIAEKVLNLIHPLPSFMWCFKLFYPMFFVGELCIDPRPAVRKSAGQTLFSTISAHANLLTSSSWNAVLWQVTCDVFSLSYTGSSICLNT